jgi:hypothetical protein
MRKSGVVIMILILFLFITVGLAPFAFAVQGNLSLSDKEIIEKLAILEEGQKGLNKRVDDMSKRIDDLRSEIKGDIADLRSELKGDIADLRGLVYIVLGGIIALIGFVIWDRRTALSPVISKTKELEERNDLTLRVLKEYAIKEPRMAETLKSLNLL